MRKSLLLWLGLPEIVRDLIAGIPFMLLHTTALLLLVGMACYVLCQAGETVAFVVFIAGVALMEALS